jgi:carbamoyl-phosphate synthase large subunit
MSRTPYPCITTLAGARAVAAMERLRQGTLPVYALQDLLGSR